MVAALGAGIAQADEEGERLQGSGNPIGCSYYPRALLESVGLFTSIPLSLTILIPGLLSPPEAAGWHPPRLPAAEQWLARANAGREPGSGDAWLLRQWGLADHAPIAALSLAGEGQPSAGRWLRADPIHQQVIRHSTLLHGDWALALSRAEADQAISALNQFFKADGLVFQAPHPGRWYVAIGKRVPPRTTPLAQLAGANPFGHLPEGDERAFWRRVFGEAQMLLNQLPLNVEREAAGRATLNGIWLWGGGERPAALPQPFARVYANTPLARGLAVVSHADACPLPPAIRDVTTGEGDTLVVLDALEAAGLAADAANWQRIAHHVDVAWFGGLSDAFRAHGEVRVALPTRTDTAAFNLTAAARWRLFRRRRRLSEYT